VFNPGLPNLRPHAAFNENLPGRVIARVDENILYVLAAVRWSKLFVYCIGVGAGKFLGVRRIFT